MSSKQIQWLDYLPCPVLAIKATSNFCAVAMQDGSVNVYSHTGRRSVGYIVSFSCWSFFSFAFWVCYRLLPALSLGSPCSFMAGNKNALLVITSSQMVYCWYVSRPLV